MTRNEYEGNVNGKLCDILKKTLNARKEFKINNKRIDILVKFDTHSVAVECELFGPNKKKEAIKDARSRLYPMRLANIAFAVVYPKNCTEDNLTSNTVIDVAIIKYEDTVKSMRQQRLVDKGIRSKDTTKTKWNKMSVQRLITSIKKSSEDLGDPDILVSNLSDALNRAVGRLSISQRKRISESLKINAMTKDLDWISPAKRALLVVASASLFHARLDEFLPDMCPKNSAITKKPFTGTWDPLSISACYNATNTITTLLNTWILILHIDYRPIFESGRNVLESLNDPQFQLSIKDIVKWSRDAASHIAMLRHDVLGRIFHVVLEDAKHDGSFYTSVPSAILLSGLTLRNRNDIPKNLNNFKIIDPACGTGTLLMAMAERVKDITKSNYDAKAMIEKVLYGVDINITALHMAATTLGLLSPDTQFSNMKIWKAVFGFDSKSKKYAAGSLEIYEKGGILPFMEWSGDEHRLNAPITATSQIDSGLIQEYYEYENSMDVVIMNPPFTTHTKRHDQLDEQSKIEVKKRERVLFTNAPCKVHKSSSGLMFLILAEHLINKTGTLSFIFPASFAIAPSATPIRKFLAEKFHIEYIISSHDPKKISFSENTKISELLVIMRRTKSSNPTKIINLAVNPNMASNAEFLVEDILYGTPNPDIQIIEQPSALIENGDWSGIQFFSSFLVNTFQRIVDGELFKVKKLGDVADVGPNGRTLVMYMQKSNVPGKEGWRSIFENKSNKIQSIQNKPYTFVIPKKGKISEANNFWSNRATLLLPERIRLNLAHVSAIKSTMPTVGTSWTGVRPLASTAKNTEKWSKAMALYLNSTLGWIAILGIKIPNVLSYPRFSLDDSQRIIPVPILNNLQIDELAQIFDKYATKVIGLLRDPDDSVRVHFDSKLCDILKIDLELVTRVREDLSREPMCTNNQYSSN